MDTKTAAQNTVEAAIAAINARKLAAKEEREPGTKVPESDKKPDPEVKDGLPPDTAAPGDDSVARDQATDATQPASKKLSSDRAAELLGKVQASLEKKAAATTPEAAVPEKPDAQPKQAAGTVDVALNNDVLAKIAAVIVSTDEGLEFAEAAMAKQAGAQAANDAIALVRENQIKEAEAYGAQLAEEDMYKQAYADGTNSLVTGEAEFNQALVGRVVEVTREEWSKQASRTEEPTEDDLQKLGAIYAENLLKFSNDTTLAYFVQGRRDAAAAVGEAELTKHASDIQAWAEKLGEEAPKVADFTELGTTIGDECVKIAQMAGLLPMPADAGGGDPMAALGGDPMAALGGEPEGGGMATPEEVQAVIEELMADGTLDEQEVGELLEYMQAAGAVGEEAGSEPEGIPADPGAEGDTPDSEDGAGEEAAGMEAYAEHDEALVNKVASALTKVRAAAAAKAAQE